MFEIGAADTIDGLMDKIHRAVDKSGEEWVKLSIDIPMAAVAKELSGAIRYAIWCGTPPKVYKSLWWPYEKKKPRVITRIEERPFAGLDSLINTGKEQT